MKSLICLTLAFITTGCCRKTWMPCETPVEVQQNAKGECGENFQDDAYIYYLSYGISMNTHAQAHEMAYRKIWDYIRHSLMQDLNGYSDEFYPDMEKTMIEVIGVFVVCETDKVSTKTYCRTCKKQNLTATATQYECKLRARYSKADYRRALNRLRDRR